MKDRLAFGRWRRLLEDERKREREGGGGATHTHALEEGALILSQWAQPGPCSLEPSASPWASEWKRHEPSPGWRITDACPGRSTSSGPL